MMGNNIKRAAQLIGV